MAKERGWWKLDLGEMRSDDLSDIDREHIAELIIEGFTSGEICEDCSDDSDDFGVFVYNKEGVCIDTFYYSEKEFAIEEAKDMLKNIEKGFYIEVCERYKDNLWTNSIEPLFKCVK